ncbi:MAG: YggT family protein [Pseudomonadota bacterium]
MGSLLSIFNLLVNLATWIIVIHAILSWLIAFEVINRRNQVVGLVWGSLERLTEPMYRPLRRMIPDLGGIDITPIFAYLLLTFAQIIVCNNFGPHPSCPLW